MGAQPASIDFARSPRSSVGVEWELALVDRGSGELVPLADDVLAAARLPAHPNGPNLHREFLTNTVELVSGAHERVGSAVADLGAGLDAVLAASHPLGIDPIGSGTHPFSRWADQEVTARERYATLVDRARWWGRQMTIWGVHVHVGIERRDKVLPIMNALLTYFPHLQALSASSPFWEGDDTGYASNRALVYQQLPTAGLPYPLEDWAAYERVVGDLRHTGVIEHHSELRWDLRPSPAGAPSRCASATDRRPCGRWPCSRRSCSASSSTSPSGSTGASGSTCCRRGSPARTSGGRRGTAWRRSSSATRPGTSGS
ncbi:hypothetical protein GCM10025874_02070 [Arenivirga flava]|uniref:Putative glutamate--cysteine ligase 2 n=1 Tax=Arenivirga flava TaxID=1930060 RepID=A0AA37X807_9MICO|nr:hypothetical protein GCM10025874_02070 [Arenivirga flava]